MDLNLMAAMLPPASPELPNARGAAKDEEPSVLPFQLALQGELDQQGPACELALEPPLKTGEEAELLEVLASDTSKKGLSDAQLAALGVADPAALAAALAAIEPATPSAPQLIVPPFAPAPATPPTDPAAAAAVTPAVFATAASAALMPGVMAQLRPSDLASTGPVGRAGEHTFARFTGAAVIPTAAQTATPGEATLDVLPGPLSAPADPSAPSPEATATRHRLSEAIEDSSRDKPRLHVDFAREPRPAATAAGVEQAPLRAEQTVSPELPRSELSAPTPAPTTATSTPTFTASQTSQYTAPQAPTATAQIPTPFGHTDWADQFRDKIFWLVDRQQQSAELHIHPEHLGPVEVMLTLNDERTSIAFVSPHPAVREAIEASFTELRATLQERGLDLGHASVSADAKDAREQLPQNGQPGRRFAGPGAATAEEAPLRRVAVQRGLVDTFA